MAAGYSEVTADIPIFDDEINEAAEDFVVVLEVVNTTNPVEFTTQTTVCRIPQSDHFCVCGFPSPSMGTQTIVLSTSL